MCKHEEKKGFCPFSTCIFTHKLPKAGATRQVIASRPAKSSRTSPNDRCPLTNEFNALGLSTSGSSSDETPAQVVVNERGSRFIPPSISFAPRASPPEPKKVCQFGYKCKYLGTTCKKSHPPPSYEEYQKIKEELALMASNLEKIYHRSVE